MIDEDEYLERAQLELKALVVALDKLTASDPGADIDCELENDIITIELADDATYIINSHRAARQLWMAANHQAWHFDWKEDESKWRATKSGEELWEALRDALGKYLDPTIVDRVFQNKA